MAIWIVAHRGVRTKYNSAKEALKVAEKLESKELKLAWTSRVAVWINRKKTGMLYSCDGLRELVKNMKGLRGTT